MSSLFEFASSLGRAQVAAVRAGADSARDELLPLIRALVKQMEDAVDLDKPSFADPRCRECTHGTTPDHLHKGPCAYHRALALLK